MAIYVSLFEKYPNFAEVNGNLRCLFDGAKVSLELGKGLDRREFEMIENFHRLLIRVKALPNEQPYRAAKIEIARAYETTDILVAAGSFEKILAKGIGVLANPILKE